MEVPSGAPTSCSEATVPPLTRISVPVALPRARVRSDEVRHGRDAGQRLAAESERADRVEVLGAGDLARRVPFERQPGVLGIHAVAVVFDAQQLLAAELDRDGDARGAGVERVLDQLLDDGGRTLDDFPGGNLVREMKREAVNSGHRL